MRRFAIVCANTDARTRLAYFKYYFATRAGSWWRFISGRQVGRSPVFRRSVRTKRRRVLRFPVRRGTRLREEERKKSRPDIYVLGDRDRHIVSQSAATCDPRGRKREAPVFERSETLRHPR